MFHELVHDRDLHWFKYIVPNDRTKNHGLYQCKMFSFRHYFVQLKSWFREGFIINKKTRLKFKSRLPDWLLWTGTPIKKKLDIGDDQSKNPQNAKGKVSNQKCCLILFHTQLLGRQYVTQSTWSLFRRILFDEQCHVGTKLEELIRLWCRSQELINMMQTIMGHNFEKNHY